MRSEFVINCRYGGLNPVQFGEQVCPSGHSFGPAVRIHWLLHYVVSGFGTFVRDGVEHRVSPGEIFVIPPHVETYYEADRERPWEYYWIGFTTDEALPEALSHPVVSCPQAGEIFEEMRRCSTYENGKSAYLAGCLWKLMATLLEQKTKQADYVDKALNCIHSEFATGITVGAIAERLNLDRSYFSNLFTRRVGTSPGAYLRSYRLNRAAELMSRYGEKPTTAALSVGYDDLFHFSKAFKQHFGVSPREYCKAKKQ
ncbi:MAG: AraC family transcriptional regulator [Clostridia bacterium]|nr:AraC family transcriptional regulator [Clostridia bacterium]MBQ5820087.1 AraC family transcriptional regulator [Clostridia bacterium]